MTEKEIFIERLKKKEADESEYWLEIIYEASLSNDNEELKRLTKEAKLVRMDEITKIMAKAKNSSYRK